MNPNRYFVAVEDWGTKWNKNLRVTKDEFVQGHDGTNFEATSGLVSPGPVQPLETDFSKLTPSQRSVMERETTYWRQLHFDALEEALFREAARIAAWREGRPVTTP